MRRFWLRVPIVGRALRAAFAYRWITSLRLEFGAGISLYRAVGDAWRASGFVNCEQLGKEGEEAVRSGSSLSTLVTNWRQLPRDWADFIETGEVSGGFDEAFKNLEAEAGRNWTLAQQRMSNWLPKIIYFVALLVIAAQVVQLGQKVIIDPIQQAENAIDNTQK
jgi:type II secretory pathway component PulF